MKPCLWLLCCWFGCQTVPIGQTQVGFNTGWDRDDPLTLAVEIDQVDQPYAIVLDVVQDTDYPYQNMYLRYRVSPANGPPLAEALQEYELFVRKTGQPLGKKKWWYAQWQHPCCVLPAQYFPEPGSYYITVCHAMRPQVLSGIVSARLYLVPAELTSNSDIHEQT